MSHNSGIRKLTCTWPQLLRVCWLPQLLWCLFLRILRFVLFLHQQMRHRRFWNLRLISPPSISSLHQIAYKGDILTVLKLMAGIQISHACRLRADHLISCLIQLHQGQDCQHLPMMIIFTCHHLLVPQCHIIEGTRKLCPRNSCLGIFDNFHVCLCVCVLCFLRLISCYVAQKFLWSLQYYCTM